MNATENPLAFFVLSAFLCLQTRYVPGCAVVTYTWFYGPLAKRPELESNGGKWHPARAAVPQALTCGGCGLCLVCTLGFLPRRQGNPVEYLSVAIYLSSFQTKKGSCSSTRLPTRTSHAAQLFGVEGRNTCFISWKPKQRSLIVLT